MSAYTQRFSLKNERAVVGRVVFLDRGQVGVVTKVEETESEGRRDWDYLHDIYVGKGKVPPLIVTIAFGLKAEKIKRFPATFVGDYDQHLAHQAELLTKLVDRRKRLPGALPFDVEPSTDRAHLRHEEDRTGGFDPKTAQEHGL